MGEAKVKRQKESGTIKKQNLSLQRKENGQLLLTGPRERPAVRKHRNRKSVLFVHQGKAQRVLNGQARCLPLQGWTGAGRA